MMSLTSFSSQPQEIGPEFFLIPLSLLVNTIGGFRISGFQKQLSASSNPTHFVGIPCTLNLPPKGVLPHFWLALSPRHGFRSQKTFYSFINPSQLQQLQTALKRHFGSTVTGTSFRKGGGWSGRNMTCPVQKVRTRFFFLKGEGIQYTHKKIILKNCHVRYSEVLYTDTYNISTSSPLLLLLLHAHKKAGKIPLPCSEVVAWRRAFDPANHVVLALI